MMNTITREQVQKIIEAADEVITAQAGTNDDVHPDDSAKMCNLWDDLNDRHAPPEVVRELARIALASMTAEPVALRWRWNDTAAQWAYTPASKMPEFIAAGFTEKNGVEIEYLYTAPPVLAVPAEMTHQAAQALFNCLMTEEEINAAVNAWNACRAAILKQSEPGEVGS